MYCKSSVTIVQVRWWQCPTSANVSGPTCFAFRIGVGSSFQKPLIYYLGVTVIWCVLLEGCHQLRLTKGSSRDGLQATYLLVLPGHHSLAQGARKGSAKISCGT